MIFLKSRRPSVFQGNLKKKRYFEGWYFKLVSADGENIFSIIPGVSLSSDRHAFVQVIEGKTGRTDYITFHINAFKASRNRFEIQIGDNYFSNERVSLNLTGEHFRIQGNILFKNSVAWESTLLSPVIM